MKKSFKSESKKIYSTKEDLEFILQNAIKFLKENINKKIDYEFEILEEFESLEELKEELRDGDNELKEELTDVIEQIHYIAQLKAKKRFFI